MLDDKNTDLTRFADFKHKMFYDFLTISPSYHLAYLLRVKKRKIKKENLPIDFEKVLTVYDKAGNVFDLDFSSWWRKIGQHLFVQDNLKSKFLFKIDLKKSDQLIKKEFEEYFSLISKQVYYPNESKIRFLKNKIRNVTLHDRFTLVENICNSNMFNRLKKDYIRPNLPYWQVALNSKRNILFFKYSKYIKQIESDELRNRSNKKNKKYVTMLVSKFLSESFVLAENAARGDFPSLTKSSNFIKFNLDDVALILDMKSHSDYEQMMKDLWASRYPISPYKLNSYHYRYEQYKNKEWDIKYKRLLKYGPLSFKKNKLDKRLLNRMKKIYFEEKANPFLLESIDKD